MPVTDRMTPGDGLDPFEPQGPPSVGDRPRGASRAVQIVTGADTPHWPSRE